MVVFALVVLFVHHGALVDRASMWVDPVLYKTSEACRAAADKNRAAYADYQNSTCIRVSP